MTKYELINNQRYVMPEISEKQGNCVNISCSITQQSLLTRYPHFSFRRIHNSNRNALAIGLLSRK